MPRALIPAFVLYCLISAITPGPVNIVMALSPAFCAVSILLN